MWTDLSIRAKDVKILVPHVNAHQKVTSAEEEEFSNQVARTAHSVDSQPLSSAILALPNGQNGHDGRDGAMH